MGRPPRSRRRRVAASARSTWTRLGKRPGHGRRCATDLGGSRTALRCHARPHPAARTLAPGLHATLDNLVQDWQRRHPAVDMVLHHCLPSDLGPSVTLAIYRVVQEGVTNALRHADPDRIVIDVETQGRDICITVSDDGVGLPEKWSKPGHFGLRGLTERLTRLGGSLQIGNHGQGSGARLLARIPLESVGTEGMIA